MIKQMKRQKDRWLIESNIPSFQKMIDTSDPLLSNNKKKFHSPSLSTDSKLSPISVTEMK